jgi:SAM-dependent methyltransferase
VQFLVDYLERRRHEIVLAHVRGRLLDIGCGPNKLVKAHGNGVGVDVYPWPGVDQVVENSATLPFEDGSFDSVSFVACLNHIPNRLDALREARRVLKRDGRLVATMIAPTISIVWHRIIRPWDDDQTDRGMKEGEVWGISRRDMVKLLESAGFEQIEMHRFILGQNTLYVAKPKAGA